MGIDDKDKYGCQISILLLRSKPTGFLVLLTYAVMCSLYVDYSSSAVVDTYAMWQAYLFRGICQ